jgi:hypothetical protein
MSDITSWDTPVLEFKPALYLPSRFKQLCYCKEDFLQVQNQLMLFFARCSQNDMLHIRYKFQKYSNMLPGSQYLTYQRMPDNPERLLFSIYIKLTTDFRLHYGSVYLKKDFLNAPLARYGVTTILPSKSSVFDVVLIHECARFIQEYCFIPVANEQLPFVYKSVMNIVLSNYPSDICEITVVPKIIKNNKIQMSVSKISKDNEINFVVMIEQKVSSCR